MLSSSRPGRTDYFPHQSAEGLEWEYSRSEPHDALSNLLSSLALQHEEALGIPLCQNDNCNDELGSNDSKYPEAANSTAAVQRLQDWAAIVEGMDLIGAFGVEGDFQTGGCAGDTCQSGMAGEAGDEGSWNRAREGAAADWREGAQGRQERTVEYGDGEEPPWQGSGQQPYFYDDYGYESGGCPADGYGDEEDYSDDLADEGGRSLGPGLSLVASFWDADRRPFLGVYHHRGIITMKLAAFEVLSGPWAAPGAFLRALHKAVVAADKIAKKRGISRLLVDVSANDVPGNPQAAYFLLRLLQSAWQTQELLCDTAELR